MISNATAFYRSLSEVSAGNYAIRNAFQEFFPGYASSNSVSQEQSKAARCVSVNLAGMWKYIPAPAITGTAPAVSQHRNRSGLWHVTLN